MSVLDKFNEGNFSEGLSELKSTQKKGVSDAYKEYENVRTIRDSQVGKRIDKRTKNEVVTVAKIPIPFQRKIVQSASVFLFGQPVKLIPSESNPAWDAIDSLWTDLRISSVLLDFCKKVKSETEAAIVVYPVAKEGQEVKLKTRVLSQDNGVIYTNFDEYGDLVAFGWEYTSTVNGQEAERLRVWTADQVYEFDGENMVEEFPKPNLFGKIPVV